MAKPAVLSHKGETTPIVPVISGSRLNDKFFVVSPLQPLAVTTANLTGKVPSAL